jgi:hypothetical protein
MNDKSKLCKAVILQVFSVSPDKIIKIPRLLDFAELISNNQKLELTRNDLTQAMNKAFRSDGWLISTLQGVKLIETEKSFFRSNNRDNTCAKCSAPLPCDYHS